MVELLLASSNKHKAEELTDLLRSSDISVISADKKIDVVEDGETFLENSLKKAQAYYQSYKRPVLADDSGLIVESLPGELGVLTARFGGEGLTDKMRCEYLLKRMKNFSDIAQRKAHFICQLCLYLSPKEIFFFEGRVNGHLAESMSGNGGFGYDPIFIPDDFDGKSTLAEANDWKQKNSHRAKASFEISKFFKERIVK